MSTERRDITRHLGSMSPTWRMLTEMTIDYEKERYEFGKKPWEAYGTTIQGYNDRLWACNIGLIYWINLFTEKNNRKPFVLEIMGNGACIEDESIQGGAYICLQEFNKRGELEARKEIVGDKPIIGCYGDIFSLEVYNAVKKAKEKLGISGFDLVICSPVGGSAHMDVDPNKLFLFLALCIEWTGVGGIMMSDASTTSGQETLSKIDEYMKALGESGYFDTDNYWPGVVTVVRKGTSTAHIDLLPEID